MSDQSGSRFAPQNKSTNERLSTTTVGLVNLSDFRKRRAEVLEQQDRESREASQNTGLSTPRTATPDNSDSAAAANSNHSDGAQPIKKKLKKKKQTGKKLLSFGDDDDDEDSGAGNESSAKEDGDSDKKKPKFKANASVPLAPKVVTKAALRKEATEREALRREFLVIQEAVKAIKIAIPFVYFDGANIPGGTVRVKKGDFVWVFLDKSRKVGAELGVGETANATRAWARVGVDDLMLVRGTIIIPHVSLHFQSLFCSSFILATKPSWGCVSLCSICSISGGINSLN